MSSSLADGNRRVIGAASVFSTYPAEVPMVFFFFGAVY